MLLNWMREKVVNWMASTFDDGQQHFKAGETFHEHAYGYERIMENMDWSPQLKRVVKLYANTAHTRYLIVTEDDRLALSGHVDKEGLEITIIRDFTELELILQLIIAKNLGEDALIKDLVPTWKALRELFTQFAAAVTKAIHNGHVTRA